MIRPATAPRVRLIEDTRSAHIASGAVVRRFRLARLRLDGRIPAGATAARSKRP